MGRLLDSLEEMGIRATFPVCGHLFLGSCRGHPDHPKPSLLEGDPCSDSSSEPGWYAPDLVQEIASKGHEIACHSFSHVSFRDPRCSIEVARFEMDPLKRNKYPQAAANSYCTAAETNHAVSG